MSRFRRTAYRAIAPRFLKEHPRAVILASVIVIGVSALTLLMPAGPGDSVSSWPSREVRRGADGIAPPENGPRKVDGTDHYALGDVAMTDQQRAMAAAVTEYCRTLITKDTKVPAGTIRAVTAHRGMFGSASFGHVGDHARLSAGCHTSAMSINTKTGDRVVFVSNDKGVWRVDSADPTRHTLNRTLLRQRGYPEILLRL